MLFLSLLVAFMLTKTEVIVEESVRVVNQENDRRNHKRLHRKNSFENTMLQIVPVDSEVIA